MMRVNRRRARSVVLGLLLVSFAGPWDGSQSYFPELVERVGPWGWSSLLLFAIIATPMACLNATIAPQSRLRVIVYRVLAGGTAAWIVFLLVLSGFPLTWMLETWGVAVYVAALVLGTVVEFARAREPEKRDYTDVFR